MEMSIRKVTTILYGTTDGKDQKSICEVNGIYFDSNYNAVVEITQNNETTKCSCLCIDTNPINVTSVKEFLESNTSAINTMMIWENVED